jgi:cytochrome c2
MTQRRQFLGAAASICITLGACDPHGPSTPNVGGNADRGRLLLQQYGCVGCHNIPGVAGARGNVGPPLKGIRNRVYLGGVITNTPQNMVRWIRAPQEFAPGTAMPNLQVSEDQAHDMVAYLYRLK